MGVADLLRPAAGPAASLAPLPLALAGATLAAVLLVAFAKAIYTWARVNYYLAKVREHCGKRGGVGGARPESSCSLPFSPPPPPAGDRFPTPPPLTPHALSLHPP